MRGVAQSGSASALGAEGRRFKSCLPDHFITGSVPNTWVTLYTEDMGNTLDCGEKYEEIDKRGSWTVFFFCSFFQEALCCSFFYVCKVLKSEGSVS